MTDKQAQDAERLSEEAARRLFERATELEARRGSELSVAELRDAAREAGITPAAFDQALAEFRETSRSSSVVRAIPRRSLVRFWPAALVLAAFLAILVMRMLFP